MTYAHPEMVDNIPVLLLEVQIGQDQDQDSASSAHPEKVLNQPAPSSSASNGISHMPINAIVPSPLVSGEQNTPLTSNISDKSKVDSTPQQQNQLSSVNLDVKLSPKLLPLLASPKLHPVNLEDNCKAANEAVPGKGQEQLDSPLSSESESGKLTGYQIPSGSFPPPNAMLQKYTYAEAWKLEPLVYCHQPKFGAGKDQSFNCHLAPELHCAICSFPELTTLINIDNMSYMNKCTNTNVWIDHDLIIGFVTFLSHFALFPAHSSSTPVGNNKALSQIAHVSSSKAQISIHGVKSLPSDVHQFVSLLHNSSH